MRKSNLVALAALMMAAWAAQPQAQTPSPPDTPPLVTQPREVLVEPEAVDALKRMSTFLMTLTNFEVVSESAKDTVMDDGQKLQFNETVTYKVARPNRFVIERMSDRKQRRLFYDGAKLTLEAPRMNYYSEVPAPGTIIETVNMMETNYGVEVPLADLFQWNTDPAAIAAIREGYRVGYAKIDGVDTDHYAFRQADFDWQIWIQKGDPLPRKVVIVSKSQEAQPQYAAELDWNLSPVFAANTFTFTPSPKSLPIAMAELHSAAR